MNEESRSPRRRPRLLRYSGLLALAAVACVPGTLSITALALSLQSDKPALYNEEQSARGESVSAKSCTVCHGEQLKGDLAPPLKGDDFLKNWTDKTAGALFTKIQATMPANEPGTMSNQQSADVVAYILKLNNFPAGQAPLSSDPSALDMVPLGPK